MSRPVRILQNANLLVVGFDPASEFWKISKEFVLSAPNNSARTVIVLYDCFAEGFDALVRECLGVTSVHCFDDSMQFEAPPAQAAKWTEISTANAAVAMTAHCLLRNLRCGIFDFSRILCILVPFAENCIKNHPLATAFRECYAPKMFQNMLEQSDAQLPKIIMSVDLAKIGLAANSTGLISNVELRSEINRLLLDRRTLQRLFDQSTFFGAYRHFIQLDTDPFVDDWLCPSFQPCLVAVDYSAESTDTTTYDSYLDGKLRVLKLAALFGAMRATRQMDQINRWLGDLVQSECNFGTIHAHGILHAVLASAEYASFLKTATNIGIDGFNFTVDPRDIATMETVSFGNAKLHGLFNLISQLVPYSMTVIAVSNAFVMDNLLSLLLEKLGGQSERFPEKAVICSNTLCLLICVVFTENSVAESIMKGTNVYIAYDMDPHMLSDAFYEQALENSIKLYVFEPFECKKTFPALVSQSIFNSSNNSLQKWFAFQFSCLGSFSYVSGPECIIVEETGATLTFEYAVSVLTMIRRQIAIGSLGSENLRFEVKRLEIQEMFDSSAPIEQYIARVWLPECCHDELRLLFTKGVLGTLQTSKKAAQQSAAFEACRLLLGKGVLDSHFHLTLSPVADPGGSNGNQETNPIEIVSAQDVNIANEETAIANINIGKESTQTGKKRYSAELSFYPDWHNLFSNDFDSARFFISLFVSETDDPLQDPVCDIHNVFQSCISFGLLTMRPLQVLPFNLDLFGKTTNCRLEPLAVNPITLTKSEFKMLLEFQAVCRFLLRSTRIPLLDFDKSQTISTDPFYFLVPMQRLGGIRILDFEFLLRLFKREEKDLGEWQIDWELISKIGSGSPLGISLVHFLREMDNWTLTNLPDGAGEFEKFCISLLLCHYNLSPLPFAVLSLKRDMTPLSQFADEPDCEYTTFVDYLSRKYNYHVQDTEQILVQAETPRQYLSYFSSRKEQHRVSHIQFFVPETFTVLHMTKSHYALLMTVPYWVYYAIHDCAVMEFFNTLCLESIPKPATIIMATTRKAVRRGVDYESLEFLGDAVLKMVVSIDQFLKFPNHSEGLLSAGRQEIIENKSLMPVSIRIGLSNGTMIADFDPRAFQFPRLIHPDWKLQNDAFIEYKNIIESSTDMNVRKKAFADMLEACIGAFFVDCGLDSAASFIHKAGLINSGIFNMRENLKTHPTNYLLSTSNQKLLFKISLKLGYQFQHLMLMAQATDPRHKGFERLEFVGDAALDLAVSQWMYTEYQDLTPHEYTELRQVLVNNDTFGRLAVGLGISEYLVGGHFVSSAVAQEISLFEDWSKSNQSSTWRQVSIKCPKVLSDCFEAIFGAILLDSGIQFDLFCKIVMDVCGEYMRIHGEKTVFDLNSVNLLSASCAQLGIQGNEIDYRCSRKDSSYECQVWIRGKMIGQAVGNGRIVAKRMAADNAFEHIRHGGFREIPGKCS